jgi:hypothetical protein
LWRIESVAWASKGKAGREVWVRPARVMRASIWIAAVKVRIRIYRDKYVFGN